MVTGASPAPGLPMVRNSSKSGSTLPSARYQAVAGLTPKASVAPFTPLGAAAKAKTCSKYTGRSASTGTEEVILVEKPTTPAPTPSAAALASMVWREEGGALGGLVLTAAAPPPAGGGRLAGARPGGGSGGAGWKAGWGAPSQRAHGPSRSDTQM